MFPPAISPIIAPMIGPKIIPNGGKIKSPAIKPKVALLIPDLVPPIIFFRQKGNVYSSNVIKKIMTAHAIINPVLNGRSEVNCKNSNPINETSGLGIIVSTDAAIPTKTRTLPIIIKKLSITCRMYRYVKIMNIMCLYYDS